MARKKGGLARLNKMTQSKGQPAEASTEPSLFVRVAQISPDPDQPRIDLLPTPLREKYFGGSLPPGDLLLAWLGLFIPAAEIAPIGPEILEANQSIQDWAQQRINQSRADLAGSKLSNLMGLIQLADQISQVGQITAITIRKVDPAIGAPYGRNYLIVTGERRFWAYNLLILFHRNINEGTRTTRKPERIKALVTVDDTVIRAHQVLENISREGLNAVELARAYASIRAELAEMEGVATESLPWGDVESFIGVTRRYRIYITNVLKLSPESLDAIAAHGFSERAVRPITSKLKERPDLQLQAVNHLARLEAAGRQESPISLPSLPQYIDQQLNPGPLQTPSATKSTQAAPRPITFKSWQRETKKADKAIASLAEQARQLSGKDQSKAASELMRLRELLDETIRAMTDDG